MSSADAPVTFIKKRKGAPSGLRKKDPATTASSSAAADEPAASEVKHAAKRNVSSHLVQGTGNKRRKTDDASALLSDSEDEADRKSYAVNHASDRKAVRRRSSSPPAWVSTEQMKEMARDKTAKPEEAKEDGLYHGSRGEKHQLPKAVGPVKGGPGNVRQITLVDYQPDVCKDYKETGFCGFGDTCKFLHDRGDYMHGWQLDNSFLSNSTAAGSFMAKQRARDGEEEDDSDSDKEDLPFACLICRKPFGPDPVVTLCGHYFDSSCAIKRFAKTGKCFACGTSTNGVFNRATKLINKQKEREELNKKAREEDDDDEGGDGGIEIEGLGDGGAEEDAHAQFERRAPRRAEPEEEEGEEEEDEEEEQRPRRRPIIEIQYSSQTLYLWGLFFQELDYGQTWWKIPIHILCAIIIQPFASIAEGLSAIWAMASEDFGKFEVIVKK